MWNVCKQLKVYVQRLFRMKLAESFYQPLKPTSVLLHNQQTALIRSAVPEDLEAIVAIEQNAYDGKPPWDRHALAVDLHYNERAAYLVAEVAERVVGFVGVRFVDEREVHITNVAVVVCERSKGVATALLSQLDQFVLHNMCRLISLEVRKSNRHAQQLYRKHGYTQTGYKEQYYYPDREDAIEMKKEVSNEVKGCHKEYAS